MIKSGVFKEKAKEYAPSVIRIGISLVILWFGFTNIFTKNLMGYIPKFAQSLPISSSAILLANGIFEIIFGFLLLLGLFTRISSLLLGLNILLIIPFLGYSDVMIRDVGLMIVLYGISLYGPDKLCLDNRVKKSNI